MCYVVCINAINIGQSESVSRLINWEFSGMLGITSSKHCSASPKQLVEHDHFQQLHSITSSKFRKNDKYYTTPERILVNSSILLVKYIHSYYRHNNIVILDRQLHHQVCQPHRHIVSVMSPQ